MGEGEGPGFGPGEKGNMGGGVRRFGSGLDGGSYGNNVNDLDRVFPANQLSVRLRILSKPEPQYTEEARRAGISGTVVLHAVFSSQGEVINIRAVRSLPCGLTERAIAAARQIRFLPALKGGVRFPFICSWSTTLTFTEFAYVPQRPLVKSLFGAKPLGVESKCARLAPMESQ